MVVDISIVSRSIPKRNRVAARTRRFLSDKMEQFPHKLKFCPSSPYKDGLYFAQSRFTQSDCFYNNSSIYLLTGNVNYLEKVSGRISNEFYKFLRLFGCVDGFCNFAFHLLSRLSSLVLTDKVDQ